MTKPIKVTADARQNLIEITYSDGGKLRVRYAPGGLEIIPPPSREARPQKTSPEPQNVTP